MGVRATSVPPPKLHASGGTFVKYSADGGSFAYYPSGRMAVAYERMGSGFYFYFYEDSRQRTTLCAFDLIAQSAIVLSTSTALAPKRTASPPVQVRNGHQRHHHSLRGLWG